MSVHRRADRAIVIPLFLVLLATACGHPAGGGPGPDQLGADRDGGGTRDHAVGAGEPDPDLPSASDQGSTSEAGPTDGGGGGDAASPDTGPPADGGGIVAGRQITVDGRRLLVDGVPLELHGVCWNPVARGKSPPADYTGFAAQDIALMRAAGINAIKTYDVITDRGVLDQLADAGIWVLMTVYAYGGDAEDVATQRADPIKDHPAILMWLVGNEWNYNGLYTGVAFNDARDRLQRIAAALHQLDPGRPVATVYGELPDAATVTSMPDVDVWGLNIYRGISFGDLFDRWPERGATPMFLSEYGADAWDARNGGMENDQAQADATLALTQEILDHSAARSDTAVTLGGTVFEWADEWWKDSQGSADQHDVGGSAPGGGPYPDQTFNEEWWGIVDIDRNPRPAYDQLRSLYVP
jgi:hypothetical protein